MQLYVQAARQIMAEIEQTEARLTELRSALQGLAPLVTPHELQAALPGVSGRRVLKDVQDVVDMRQAPAAIAGPAADAPSATLANTESAGGNRSTISSRASTKKPARKVVRSKVKRGKAVRTDKRTSGPTGESSPRSASGLPATGAAFWLATLGKRRHTVKELVTKALSKLALDESARPVLTNRANAWLYPALKAGSLRYAEERGGLKTYQAV